MAKPREIYNTPAPQAMGQMGAGIAESYGRAGEMMMRGYASAGESIGKGIASIGQAVGQAYGDYKKMQSQIKTSEGFYNTLKESGYLPPELAKGIDATVNSEVYKNMGTAEKAQFWSQATNFAGNAIGQFYKMQQIEAEQKGLLDRTIAGKKPVPDVTDYSPGLTQAISDQQPSQTAPKTAAPMPGSELDFERAISTLETHMVKKYGPDYRLRKIQATQQDMKEAGLQ